MTRSIELDGRRLTAPCAAEFDEMAASLLERIASTHERGKPLRPGAVVEFVWAPLRIEEQGADWVVCEPEFGSEPLRWRPGVDTTLDVLDRQLAVVRSLGLPPEVPRWNQNVRVAPGADDADEIFLMRSSPSDGRETGWYVGIDRTEVEPDARKARAVSVLELVAAHRDWMDVLALPRGYLVTLAHGRVRQVIDPNDNEVSSGADGDEEPSAS
jgi:hypothetical protein